MNRLSVLVFVLLAAILPASVRAQQDQVFGAKGTPTRGTISAITPTQVTILVNGIPRPLDVKDIVKVTFGDEPDELDTARKRLLAGHYEEALADLAKIDVSKVTLAGIKQDIDYYNAFCAAKLALGAGGDKAKAAKQMFGFVRDNQNTYHFFEAVQLLGDLAVALEKYENAASFYAQLAKAPWPEYQLRAAVLESRALVTAGKYPEALTKFEQVINAPATTPDAAEQRMYATVGKAVCLGATGKPDEGIKLLEELIAQEDATEAKLLGRAYNAMGFCYLKADKKKDALLAYLHTELLFNDDAETHAEALYYLSRLWNDVNQPDRAARARTTLQSDYAGSRWAAMK